jgi:hypothetical protein
MTTRITILGGYIGKNGAGAVDSLSTNLGGVKRRSIRVETAALNVLGALDLKPAEKAKCS